MAYISGMISVDQSDIYYIYGFTQSFPFTVEQGTNKFIAIYNSQVQLNRSFVFTYINLEPYVTRCLPQIKCSISTT